LPIEFAAQTFGLNQALSALMKKLGGQSNE
jgi:hypothetical protein